MIHDAEQMTTLDSLVYSEVTLARQLKNGQFALLFGRGEGGYGYMVLEPVYNRETDMAVAVSKEPLTDEEQRELGW